MYIKMGERLKIRWNIFAGIMFTVIGMCLLNYYALFPEADVIDEKRYNIDDVDKKTSSDNNDSKSIDEGRYLVYKDAA